MNSEINSYKQPSQTLQKWVKVVTHFLCLGIIFILPEVLVSRSFPAGSGIPWGMYAKSLLFVAVFYINYYIIIDYCLGRRRWVLRLTGLNVVIIIVTLLCAYFLMDMHSGEMPRRVPRHVDAHADLLRRVSFLMRDMVMVILTVALSVAMKLSDYWVKLNRQRQEMEMVQHKEELESLKKQLNPHFLFNTLNSIYALIAISPDKAQQAVHELSQLLRYVLYENSPTVPIQDELTFIDNYVKLMKLRIGDKMPINVTLDSGDCNDCHIAPLLFISPVENAFKYGNTGRSGDSIDISIVCREGSIHCHIANNFIDSEKRDIASSGIGNVNLRRRLDLIYGNKAEMSTKIDGDRYIVDMIITL